LQSSLTSDVLPAPDGALITYKLDDL